MAEDHTGKTGGDASKDQPVPTPAKEEAIVLEETVVKPAPHKEAPPPVSKPLAPSGTLPSSVGPMPSPTAKPVVTPPVAQQKVQAAPLPSPQPPIVQASAPDLPHTNEESAKERAALSRILEEARLPERRTIPGETPEEKVPHVFDTRLGAEDKKPPPRPAPVPHLSVSPPNAAGEESETDTPAGPPITPVHTLQDDLQDIVRVKKLSVIKAAALESEKRGRTRILEEPQAAPRSHRTFRILFISGLLILLGSAGLLGVFIIMQERSGIAPTSQGSSIVFAESSASVSIEGTTPLDLKRLLTEARGGGGTLGSITQVVPTVATVSESGAAGMRRATTEEFLKALGTRAPPELLRALSSDFFFGIHTVDENAPLFVIPVLSYERAFAGMLAWEQTMNADLSPVFTSVPDQVMGGNGLPEKRRFDDVVMRNYDVRALKDDAGLIQLYYSFPTQYLLVIGESPYSFNEIMNRLRAERKL